MKKVIWIVYWPNYIYLTIAQEFGKKVDLYLIFEKKYQNTKFLISNYTPIFLSDILIQPNLVFFFGLLHTLSRINPDIIICSLFYMPATWQAWFYSLTKKTRLTVQSELKMFPRNRLYSFFVRYALIPIIVPVINTRLHSITCWTEDSSFFIKKYFPLSKTCRVYTVPPGIDTTLFKPSKGIKKSNHILKLLMAARLVKYKNHYDVLDAIRILADHRTDFNLTFLDNGPEKNNLVSRVNKLNLDPFVTFIDRVPYTDMPKTYSQYDALLLTSFNEAIGMVVPEAMACGLPVVVSDTCGAKQYVENNISGYIFNTHDSKDLYEKILLLYNKNNRLKMGKNAEKAIKGRYNIQTISRKLYTSVFS